MLSASGFIDELTSAPNLILSVVALVGYGFITAIIEIIKNIFGWLLYYAHLWYLQLIVPIGYGKNIINFIKNEKVFS